MIATYTDSFESAQSATTLTVVGGVLPGNNSPPVFSVNAEAAVDYDENDTDAVATYTASDADADEDDTLTYSLTTGDADFNIVPEYRYRIFQEEPGL